MAEISNLSEAAEQNALLIFNAHWAVAMQQPDLKQLAPMKQHLSQMYMEGYKRGVNDTMAAIEALKDPQA